MNELSWLEINLTRLEHNLAWWRALVAGPKAGPSPLLCAVVKANAYGLGAVPVAQCLEQAGVDMMAVYSPAQAEELVDAGIHTPILILMPTRELEHTDAIHQAAALGRLHLAINDPGQLDMVAQLGAHLNCRIPVHLHLDTGMSRAGLDEIQFVAALAELPQRPTVKLAGIYSHFATADNDANFAYTQVEKLEHVLAQQAKAIGPNVLVHISATFGTLRDRRFHKDMVRIGFGLYGHGPDLIDSGPMIPAAGALQPAIRWVARIIHVQAYPAGAPVGYGCTHKLKRDSVLGVVPVGYADGFSRSMSNRAAVRLVTPSVDAAIAPVVGTVSMDQIVIDLTDLAQLPGAKVGGMVELISSDPNSPCSLPKVAAMGEASPYEVLCRLSPRVPRRYVSIQTPAGLSARLPLGN